MPSAICVPHPLQKAIDFPRTSGLPQTVPNKAKTVSRPAIPERRKLSESGVQGKQNRVFGETRGETDADSTGRSACSDVLIAFSINMIRRARDGYDHFSDNSDRVAKECKIFPLFKS